MLTYLMTTGCYFDEILRALDSGIIEVANSIKLLSSFITLLGSETNNLQGTAFFVCFSLFITYEHLFCHTTYAKRQVWKPFP